MYILGLTENNEIKEIHTHTARYIKFYVGLANKNKLI